MRFAPLAVCLSVLGGVATPQDGYDREKAAREYVQFLVLQLDQWSKEFPQQFYGAVMKPPVDAGRLSDAAKAGPSELSESIKRLAALSAARDLMTNAEFRNQLARTLSATKEMNQAMSVQRFPAIVQSS